MKRMSAVGHALTHPGIFRPAVSPTPFTRPLLAMASSKPVCSSGLWKGPMSTLHRSLSCRRGHRAEGVAEK